MIYVWVGPTGYAYSLVSEPPLVYYSMKHLPGAREARFIFYIIYKILLAKINRSLIDLTWSCVILSSLSKEIVMYLVIWWNAMGHCLTSERMSYIKACAFRDSMDASQEAGLMYVNE